MATVDLTKAQARAIILHAAGLTKIGQFGKGQEAAYKVIDQLGFIQVDTNYVVERRIIMPLLHACRVTKHCGWKNCRPMEGSTNSGHVIQVYAHNRLSVLTTNTRKFLNKWKSGAVGRKQAHDKHSRSHWTEGPLGAKDFENDRTEKSSGWWDWRPSKVALERLHLTGQLLTIRKKRLS